MKCLTYYLAVAAILAGATGCGSCFRRPQVQTVQYPVMPACQPVNPCGGM